MWVVWVCLGGNIVQYMCEVHGGLSPAGYSPSAEWVGYEQGSVVLVVSREGMSDMDMASEEEDRCRGENPLMGRDIRKYH